MQGKCKDCEFWASEETLERIKNMRCCKKCYDASESRPDKDDLFATMDCENYGSELLTRGNFGCVCFKKRI